MNYIDYAVRYNKTFEEEICFKWQLDFKNCYSQLMNNFCKLKKNSKYTKQVSVIKIQNFFTLEEVFETIKYLKLKEVYNLKVKYSKLK